MSTAIALQLGCMSVSEVRSVTLSFVDKLDNGELLTGTPVIEEVGASGLTITNKVVNTAQLTLRIGGNDETVAIGKAVQFLVTGVTDGTVHKVKAVVSSDSTPAQTLIGVVRIEGIADSE